MKLFSVLAVCFFLLSACSGSGSSSNGCSGKQVTCPSFNDNLTLQWIPYKKNQQIIFNSSTAGSDTFNISDVTLSSSYQASVTAGHPFCSAEANFQTPVTDVNTTPQFWISISRRHDQFNNTEENQAHFSIKRSSFQGAGFSDSGLIKSYDYSFSHFYNTATIGSKTFLNIQEVSLDTTQIVFKSFDIYRFWMAKDQGIVGYEEYHGNLWVKQ